jgi:hypothetical protein
MKQFLAKLFGGHVRNSSRRTKRRADTPGTRLLVENLEGRMVLSNFLPADLAEAYDQFGSAVAAGDFNGDGYGDVAVGVVGEDFGSVVGDYFGAVHVIYGTKFGLAATGDQVWTQDSLGIEDSAYPGDRFGSVLAAGDLNGDGYDDLAIGAPNEIIGGMNYAGGVNVIYGSPSGLTAKGNQFWTQDSPGIEDSAESSDHFGVALAAGDFNLDGYDDLAVGVYGESIGSLSFAGAVNVIYGSKVGLTAIDNQFWHQDSPGIQDSAEEYDAFGLSLAVGDFNGDGYDDLAVGVYNEEIGSILGAGAVNVFYSSEFGLKASGNQFWHQDSIGIEDSVESGDYFGRALAAADFNNDGRDDLAVGVFYEDIGVSSRGLSGSTFHFRLW